MTVGEAARQPVQWHTWMYVSLKLARTLSNSNARETERGEDTNRPALPLKHVAIIMDGNRRWADLKRMPRLKGHQEGVKALKEIVKHAGTLALGYLTVYAFSSENWQRSREEVRYLFELFSRVLSDEFEELHASKVRLTFLGDMSAIPSRLRKSFDAAMEKSKNNTGLSLQVAINYGSRLEITTAVRDIVQEAIEGKISAKEVTEQLIESRLFTSGMPDPELIIRTGGEMRLSNYLLWQAAYSELYITEVLWPDFTPDQFDLAIEEFRRRERRYGT